MLIGSNYDKLELIVGDILLLEPIGFFGDLLIFLISVYFAYKIIKRNVKSSFFTYWIWFFLIFGTSMLIGGFGHLMYHYWGESGKYMGWYSSLFATTCLELAFISIYPNLARKKLLTFLAFGKLIAAILLEFYLLSTNDIDKNEALGVIIPSINSFIGLGYCAGYLSYYYQNKFVVHFHYFWISILILIPASIFQLLKINPHQYFDRNDVSHLLLILTLFTFYKGLQKLAVIDLSKSLD